MPDFIFDQTPLGLGLKSTKPELSGIFMLDYLQGNLGYRLTPERVLHEPLAKVIDHRAFVLDATGGLGKDALMLALMGCKVWMCEAHPLLIPLIQDGLQRAFNDPAFKSFFREPEQFRFFPTDAKVILLELMALSPIERPDIVYLDPMFPLRKKSSLVKKEMQWLKAIHEDSSYSSQPSYFLTPEKELFQLAIETAQKRVVVKRPLHAPTLVDTPKPNFRKLFQSARFDVYLI